MAPAPTAGISTLAGSQSDLSRFLRLFCAEDPAELAALGTLLRWGQIFGGYRRSLRQGLRELAGDLAPAELEALVDEAALLSPEPIVGFLAALQHWRPQEELKRVRAPVTVLWGDLDRIIPREAAAATAADFPDGRLVVWEGVGHSPQLERPDEFARFAFGLV